MGKGRSDEIPGEVRSLLAKLCEPHAGIAPPFVQVLTLGGRPLGVGGVDVRWEGEGVWSVCCEGRSVPIVRHWRQWRNSQRHGAVEGGWEWRAGWPWGSADKPWAGARSPCLSKDPQGYFRFPTPAAWCVSAFRTARGNEKVWRRVKAIKEAAGVDEAPDDCRAFKPGGLSHAFDYYSESQERRALAALLCLVAWRMMEEAQARDGGAGP